jgi:hypothetical protein
MGSLVTGGFGLALQTPSGGALMLLSLLAGPVVGMACCALSLRRGERYSGLAVAGMILNVILGICALEFLLG